MAERAETTGDSDFASATSTTHTSTPEATSVVDVLSSAPITVLGRMPWSSNATFLVELGRSSDEGSGPSQPEPAPSEPPQPDEPQPDEPEQVYMRAVYKPAVGEQPLWDFPPGLWKREIASHELSEALGFGLVPTTVRRTDAPFGEGSLQLFIDARFDEHYFTILESNSSALDNQLRMLCAFDLVINSADRKGGHCLLDSDDRIWAIDNGLSFHPESKLRTVIWDFAGEPVPDPVLKALEDLCETGPPDSLDRLLDGHEIQAVLLRAERVVNEGVFPFDPTGRSYPWPLV